MKLLNCTLLIATLVFLSCSTGKKAYERGDYYTATIQAVNRLRNNPDSKKANEALRNSYPQALKYYQGRIENSLNSDRQFKYSESVDYYEALNHMADEISRCPAALRLFPDVEFYASELANARQLAAEENYSAALAAEHADTRESWKQAYLLYEQAGCYVPGYKDIAERMAIAKHYATLTVILEYIPVPRAYQITSDFFLEQVIEALENEHPNEFVAYFTPESAERSNLTHPDHLLKMNFDEFVIGQMYDRETVTELSRDSVEIGTVKLDDGIIKKVYGTVTAKLHSYRREVISHGRLDLSISDFALNRIISQRKFDGQFVWYNEWATFNGDERALTSEQLRQCDLKPVMPPPPQELFVQFTKPIYNQVTPFLRDFYRNY